MREEGGRKVDRRKKMMETREGKRVFCVVCALSTTEPNHVIVESMRTLVRSMSQILKCSEASRFRSVVTFPPFISFTCQQFQSSRPSSTALQIICKIS